MTKKRLSKALAAAGIASRRACETIIQEGRVHVNGKAVYLPQTLVDLSKDKVVCDGQKISKEEKKVYFLLNKPAGYICSNRSINQTKRVVDLFGGQSQRLFTVGRLDKETTGLIIVTNDGHFANRVIHPSSGIQKEYLAKTHTDINHEHLARISKGGFIEGTFVKPVRVKKIRKGTIKIVIMEGKKREVRQLLEKAGLSTVELSRIRIGNLLLGNLATGSWRALNAHEREEIFEHSKKQATEFAEAALLSEEQAPDDHP
jgi:23S rRNA pseudouridine2605 synthase